MNGPSIGHAANYYYSGHRCYRCHCYQSNNQLEHKQSPHSVDSMNYLLKKNSQSYGRNADANAAQTNNELYTFIPYIDFNEINDFRKRYAAECISISTLNQHHHVKSMSSSLSCIASISTRNDGHCFDWSEMRQLFYRNASGYSQWEFGERKHRIEYTKPSFDRSANPFALRHQPTKE